ncbi:MAG: neuromedin U [Deltaproteobacteria bacterium]|nr:neuromedin U [Deltaproteobacteria bacterium]
MAMLTAVPGWTQEELAKQSQNPVGNIISVPFENNTSFGVGPKDAVVNTLNLKPVYPVNIGRVNLINRFILPVIYQEERIAGEGSEFGLGDFSYQAFFSPAEPSGIIWGAGPAFVFPTNTNDRLGVDKWSVGPSVVVLAKPGPWLIGGLVQNIWSYAGDDDAPDVNFFSFQYFINYNFESGWYISSTPTITANWEADSDDRWTVPFGGGIGKLVRFGKLPVDIKAQAFWYAEKPDGAADWTLQLQFKLLFPK